MRIEIGGGLRQADDVEHFGNARALARAVADAMRHQRLGNDGMHPKPWIERRIGILKHRLRLAPIGIAWQFGGRALREIGAR